MLQDAFKDCGKGIMIRFRTDSGVLQPSSSEGTKAKVSSMLLLEQLFADDYALMVYILKDVRSVVNNFRRAAGRNDLITSIKKTGISASWPSHHDQNPAAQSCWQVLLHGWHPVT